VKSWVQGLLAIGCAVVLTLGVAACGDDDDDDAAPAQAAPAAPKVEFTGSVEEGLPDSIPEPKKDDLTIGFPSALEANEAVNALGRAAKLETERMGGTFVSNDAKGQPDLQVSNMEQLIARDVDGLLVWPLDSRALAPMLRKAKQAGIPVVGVDVNMDAPDPGPDWVSQIWLRRDLMSYMQVREAASLLPEGGKFVQMGFAVPVPTIEKQVERAAFWGKEFGLTPLGRADNQSDDIAGGEQAMTQLLGKYPDADGLIAYNEESATGASAAARVTGNRDMPLVGNNGGSLGFSSVRDGKIAATVQMQIPDAARSGIWALYTAIQGGDVPKTILTGEPKLVTDETVDSVPTWDDVLDERYGKTK
jgi:ribose transport system substrate-binding protein